MTQAPTSENQARLEAVYQEANALYEKHNLSIEEVLNILATQFYWIDKASQLPYALILSGIGDRLAAMEAEETTATKSTSEAPGT